MCHRLFLTLFLFLLAGNFQAGKADNERADMFKSAGTSRDTCDSDDTICSITSLFVTCCPPSHPVCCDPSLGGCCTRSFPVCCSDAHGGCCRSGQTCDYDKTGKPICSSAATFSVAVAVIVGLIHGLINMR